ncbi:MAG: hypothetical protein IIY04_04725 [Oscillospiraceae bacterium]|nr:hypothetical protein [Oscillospiraceae bacterium]
MKKCVCLILCALMLVSVASAIETRTHMAYLVGYPDGTIRPHEIVTKEMLAQILLRLMPYEPQEDAFFDVPPTRWSYKAVCMVTELGIMHAEHGYFHPTEPVYAGELARALSCKIPCDAEKPITRAELAKILNQHLHRQMQSADHLMLGMPTFSDNLDANAWYYLDLQEAACTHTYEFAPNGELWTGLG